ncbi:anti-sigma factor antagonist [Streptomyces sp. NPDC127072]|uniref:anti-sigma factor antagonist n=1 Tax=Streptomyces sp. NPDC127072 TaxID=3347129 RepID=UPI00364EC83C
MGGGAPTAPVRPSTGHERPRLEIETRPAGDRTLVVLTGAIDLVTQPTLRDGLQAALARSARGIDLDLSGVDFCDCSGLNVLLFLRQRALAEDKTVAIQAVCAAVHRLFSVTGTLPLFAMDDEPEDAERITGAHPDTERPPGGNIESVESLGEANEDLRIELVQLRRALRTRPVIDLARGVLMASFSLSADDAWKVLVTVSQNTNTKLRQVAEDLVGAVTGDALSEQFQLEVAETVTMLRTAPAPTPVACEREE